MNTIIPKTPFTKAEFEAAHDLWGVNCGPGAFAALLGFSLAETRQHFAPAGFEEKRFTNAPMMITALKAARVNYRLPPAKKGEPMRWPHYGLARIQWEGPWTQPGVPMVARYRYTHWVAAAHAEHGVGIFDVNALNMDSEWRGWAAERDWDGLVAPHITEGIKRANGKWHITHVIEVAR